ncbi:MAG: class I SAM-dependent methyltransferase [Bryobacteraceae bacterium]
MEELFGHGLCSIAYASVGYFRLDLPEGIILFSDWSDRSGTDTVLAPGETTAVLYRAALPYAAQRRVWDLGCGSGALALLLAGCAARILGTDINPRAIALSRWNAAINDSPAQFRLGSLAGPVDGERFDLIVAQPPYLPFDGGPHSSATRSQFLHGGDRGDEIAHQVLELAPRHLAPGGVALVFTDWLLGAGEDLEQRLPPIEANVHVHYTRILAEAWSEAYGLPCAAEGQVLQSLIAIRPAPVPRLRITEVHGNWQCAPDAA